MAKSLHGLVLSVSLCRKIVRKAEHHAWACWEGKIYELVKFEVAELLSCQAMVCGPQDCGPVSSVPWELQSFMQGIVEAPGIYKPVKFHSGRSFSG